MRPLYFVAGWLCVGLGFAGVILPLVPTTPFLLLAAFCFARSSPRWHRWLREHRLFGPLIRDWQAHRAIHRNAKWSATIGCGVVLAASLVFRSPWLIIGIQLLVLSLVLISLWRLPEPPPEQLKP